MICGGGGGGGGGERTLLNTYMLPFGMHNKCPFPFPEKIMKNLVPSENNLIPSSR
jgi:hypothetical protein